jgi:hypothetical protein
MANRGKREFIQTLRLIEVFPETLVAAAALDAIRLSAISFDAVKQLVIAKIEHRPAKLDLCGYPYLPAANVKTTSAADYMALVSGRAAMTARFPPPAQRRRRFCSHIIYGSSNRLYSLACRDRTAPDVTYITSFLTSNHFLH